MKKLLAGFLALTLALSMAACSGGGNSPRKAPIPLPPLLRIPPLIPPWLLILLWPPILPWPSKEQEHKKGRRVPAFFLCAKKEGWHSASPLSLIYR